jgi:CheY-like chemotaxis protein
MNVARNERADRTDPSPAAQFSDASRTLSILVVDDDPDSAEALAALFRHWQHRVWVANDARDAMAMFREKRPDLVLLDIALPGMDGYQLAVRFRAEEHQAVLVALTGYADRKRAFSAGFDEHFRKPVEPEALRELLSRVGASRPRS